MEQKYTLENVKDMLIKKIKDLDKNLEIEDKGEILEISTSKKKSKFGMGLGNVLIQMNSGDNPEAVIESRINVIKNMLNMQEAMKQMETWEFVKDKIIFVPIKKSFNYSLNKGMEEKTKKGKKPDEVYTKGFIQDIVLAGAIDFPGYFAYMTKNVIKKWKKTNDEIDEQIGKNLQKFETEYQIIKNDNGLFILGGMGILSTFLLKPKKLRNIADKNGFKDKELVITVPFRDLIIVTENNMNNAMKVWSMSSAMMRDEIRAYPISSKPFIVDKDGIVNKFSSDQLPVEGVMVAVDPKTKKVETLALGSKDHDIMLPTAEEFEALIHKDKKVQDVLSVILGSVEGIPLEEFAETVLDWTKDKELAKKVIEFMIKGEWIKMKNGGKETKVFPTEKTIKMILDKNKGRQKWDL